MPIDERAVMFQCAGQELNLHSLAGWLLYRQLGSPMPSRRMFSSGAGGSRTRRSPRFELGRFADLRTAPRLSKAPSTGFEPAISCVTGRRALQAAPRGRCIFYGPGGTRTHSIPGSKPRWSAGCLPSRAQGWSRTDNRLGLSQAALPIGVPGRKWSRMELNHRFLGVGQASWPLDHGTVASGVTGSRTRISSVRSWRRPVGL